MQNGVSLSLRKKVVSEKQHIKQLSRDYRNRRAGAGKLASYHDDTVKRIEEIQVPDSNAKAVLFNLIDTYIRDAKARRAYAS